MKFLRLITNLVLVLSAVMIIAIVSPMVFGYELIVIESGSMEPTLKVGSVCYTHKESIIHERDIVTYYTGSNDDVYVTHRVVDINPDGSYLLKGDNSNMEDQNQVTDDNIIGTVKLNIPYVGYCIKFISTLEGKVAVILGLLTLLVFSELADKTIQSSRRAGFQASLKRRNR